jgi:hypothetical protein
VKRQWERLNRSRQLIFALTYYLRHIFSLCPLLSLLIFLSLLCLLLVATPSSSTVISLCRLHLMRSKSISTKKERRKLIFLFLLVATFFFKHFYSFYISVIAPSLSKKGKKDHHQVILSALGRELLVFAAVVKTQNGIKCLLLNLETTNVVVDF